MHSSECGRVGHNKKGHQKFIESQLEQPPEITIGMEEEIDVQSIL